MAHGDLGSPLPLLLSLVALPIAAATISYWSRVALDDAEHPPAQNDVAEMDEITTGTMNGIADGIEEMIGNTPLVRIRSLSDATGCDILGKAEFLNPGGSSKDRVALSILLHAEKQGLITPHSGCVVFEGTVGSTGIALAVVCRARGYGCHIVMPNDQANEKYAVLEALGAVVEKVRPSSIVDPTHYVNLARRRAQEFTKLHATASAKPSYPSPRGLFADQFDTPANRAAHTSTADEVWRQTQGKIDAFVMGAGTGGTLAGVGQRLKKRTMGRVKVVCADPQGSAIHNRITHGVMFSETEREGHRGRHQVDSIVEGIGLNRVTGNLVAALDSAGAETLGGKWIDGSEKVTDEEAAWMARWLVEHDGLWVGSSSCVNLVGAVRVARKLRREREHVGDRRKVVVVTVLCDSGARGASRFWNKDVIRRDVGDVGIAADEGKRALEEFL